MFIKILSFTSLFFIPLPMPHPHGSNLTNMPGSPGGPRCPIGVLLKGSFIHLGQNHTRPCGPACPGGPGGPAGPCAPGSPSSPSEQHKIVREIASCVYFPSIPLTHSCPAIRVGRRCPVAQAVPSDLAVLGTGIEVEPLQINEGSQFFIGNNFLGK